MEDLRDFDRAACEKDSKRVHRSAVAAASLSHELCTLCLGFNDDALARLRQQWWDTLERDGYVHIPAEQVRALRAPGTYDDICERAAASIKANADRIHRTVRARLADPDWAGVVQAANFNDREYDAVRTGAHVGMLRGITQQWASSHDGPVYELRHAIASSVFAILWNAFPRELALSLDAVNYSRPGRRAVNTPLPHVDYNVIYRAEPKGRNLCVQGSVALSDTPPGGACFLVVRGSHRFGASREFEARHRGSAKRSHSDRDWRVANAAEMAEMEAAGCEVRRIRVRKGDVVLWYSHTFHCGAETEKEFTRDGHADDERIVAYVCATPKRWLQPCEIDALRAGLANGVTTSHWPGQGTVFAMQDVAGAPGLSSEMIAARNRLYSGLVRPNGILTVDLGVSLVVTESLVKMYGFDSLQAYCEAWVQTAGRTPEEREKAAHEAYRDAKPWSQARRRFLPQAQLDDWRWAALGGATVRRS